MSNDSLGSCATEVEVAVVSLRSGMTRRPHAHSALVRVQIEFAVTAAVLSSCDLFVEAMAAE